ncbi:sugar ABC transporter permease [Paenibacillus sp. F411]|uniref:Binding-protein-dependent transporters inner membrane component n=1 Tax=Paenibacillus algicola TaxID=2565926 RepID=A0A4P8XIF0_9BACL|nr:MULTISPECIES: sugar ABC transporter permease [Paenibacillus]MBO2944363.1 sugar ABC transporter permease [Paenibacillus sp. F411]QCT01081.1 binding-protein-dependent transporters inner membrane component [Paenibacillus algicola]
MNTPGESKLWHKQSFKDHVSAYLYLLPFFLIFGIFTLFPVFWSAYISFFSWDVLGTKKYIGFQNYIWLFTDDPKFWKSVLNTFSIWLMSTIPNLFLALVLANILNQRFIKGKKLFRLGVIIPNITSLVAVAVIFGSFFGYNYGLINYFLSELGLDKYDWGASYWGAQFAVAVMVIWRWTGYNAVIYLAALQSIPADLYEAARIDGASRTQQFFKITIPMIRPMIIFTVIMSTIGGMQLFVEPLIFSGPTGGPEGQTLTMVLYLYTEAFTNNNYGYASAIAWMLFLIILLFSMFNNFLTKKINSAQ